MAGDGPGPGLIKRCAKHPDPASTVQGTCRPAIIEEHVHQAGSW